MNRKSHASDLGGLITLALLALIALGGTFTTAFANPFCVWRGSSGSLPSANGLWQYYNAGASQTLAAGELTLETVQAASYAYYQQDSALTFPSRFVLVARLRVVSEAGIFPTRGPAALVFVSAPGTGNALEIKDGEIFLLGDSTWSAEVPTSDAMHTYRMVVDIPTGSIDVYYDGALVIEGESIFSINDFGIVPRVLFGDTTSLISGTTEWAFVRHNASTAPCGGLFPRQGVQVKNGAQGRSEAASWTAVKQLFR